MDALRTLDGEAARQRPPNYDRLVTRARRLKDVFKPGGSRDIFAT
jgi:hypothetical protein